MNNNANGSHPSVEAGAYRFAVSLIAAAAAAFVAFAVSWWWTR